MENGLRMKLKNNLMLTTLFVTLSIVSFAQSGNKPIKASLNKVIVYLQGAQLYYTESVMLKAGYNELTFENISPQINVPSLQANSKGGLMMDVKYNIKYREKPITTNKYNKEIAQLKDSMEETGFMLEEVQYKIQVLESEKKMLFSNPVINGTSRKDSLLLLKEGITFLREKLNNIFELQLKLERQKSRIIKTKSRQEERYNLLLQLSSGEGEEQQTSEPVSVPQVKVTVYSENAGLAQVSFNYYIAAASWTPNYELSAFSAQNNLQLKYFGTISQTCGINWQNVPLVLSTSNPQENNVKPELSNWYLSFVQQRQKTSVKYKHESDDQEDVKSLYGAPTSAEFKVNNNISANELNMGDYINVTENLIRTEYEIKLNYTISTDGQPHKVVINQRELPMQLQFNAVPKLCTNAFLMANITQWEDMNIIPGTARLFFDDAFIGDVFLNASSTSDTLSVNLGRDKSITMTRKKIKDKNKSRLLDNERVETRSFEIVVRNTKNTSINMVVEDQIPVPYNTEEIKVNLLDSDDADYDPLSGKLTWKVKLGSKESKKLVFTYEVRYPKNKTIYGL